MGPAARFEGEGRGWSDLALGCNLVSRTRSASGERGGAIVACVRGGGSSGQFGDRAGNALHRAFDWIPFRQIADARSGRLVLAWSLDAHGVKRHLSPRIFT